ncbi:MAG: cytochrome c peroxidase [Planctomycetota bacterium]
MSISRSRFHARWLMAVVAAVGLTLTACSPPSEPKGGGSSGGARPKSSGAGATTGAAGKKDGADKAEKAEPAQPAAESPAAEASKPADAKPANAPKTPENKPADEPKAADPKPADSKPAGDQAQAAKAKVTLGHDDLTSGIPGDGPLTVEQLSKWLASPANHEVLDVELPLGLAAGKALISIPEDNPLTRAKIELGRQLYFDPRLSADGKVSCASCHHPDDGYARHTQFGVGINGQMGGRNSPVSYNRLLSSTQFWDGRAASLEAQAVGPIANPIEMGNTHEKCVEKLKSIDGYRLQFEKIFGSEGVTIGNVGKAIASFERVIVTGPSAYDYHEPLRVFQAANAEDLKDLEALKKEDAELFAKYEALKKASDAHPFSPAAERGRALFFSEKANCTACHAGANFTDEKYHNLGVGMEKEKPDIGRQEVTKDEKDRGAFKTPTVRNVAQTAPYMHDGSQKSLAEVVEWYAKAGHPNPQLSEKVKKLSLTDEDKKDLVAFMEALTGEFPKVRQDRLPE